MLAGLSLLLVILLVSLRAYLRLAHSGIGCLDWPECYGRIGVPEVTEPMESAPEQMASARARGKKASPCYSRTNTANTPPSLAWVGDPNIADRAAMSPAA